MNAFCDNYNNKECIRIYYPATIKKRLTIQSLILLAKSPQPQLHKLIFRYHEPALFKSFSPLVIDFFQHIFPVFFKSQMDFSMTDRTKADDVSIYVQAVVKRCLHGHGDDMVSFHIGFMGALGHEGHMVLMEFTGVMGKGKGLVAENGGALPMF